MARSPFQGNFVPNVRPTIVTAPDAIVYINGETEIMGCPSCRRRFDINKYIVSVQADLSVDSVPGSCSISLSIPRHAVDDFYFDGKPIIQPMMEVEVFAKGYYLIEGQPQYYPIFWGLVTEVGESYSSGEHTISIQCNDILKWWEICKMNISPAFTQTAGQMGRDIFQNVFYGKNPYDVIWSLAQQSFGDVIVGTGSLTSMTAEDRQKTTFTNALQDLMRYWQSRFQRIRSNLLLYGTRGTSVRGDSLDETYRSGKGGSKNGAAFASSAVAFANGGVGGGAMVYDPSDPDVVAFRTQFGQAGQVNFWQSEYQTKLELANAAKEAIGFEFFMDVTGDIVFKPPFYNLDTLSNKPVSWIQDIDVIDWDFSESESEVVTQLILQGSFGGNVEYNVGEEATPFTSVTDYHLLRQYGWRSQTYNSEFLGDPQMMFYTGMDILDKMNARRHRGTVNIPLRPELRLGFPVYVASKDQFWYLVGISHNIQFGGRAQTTLTLTARRSKFIAPHGIGKLNLKSYKPPAAKQNVSGGSTTVASAASVLKDAKTPYAKEVASLLAKASAKSGTAKGGGMPEPDKGGSTGGVQPKPDTNAQASAFQLAAYATFALKVGDAALMPGTPPADNTAPTSTDAYAPVILRHPKTGRILGWPNVVMVYTRPYKNIPAPTLAQQAGMKKKISGRGRKPVDLKKVEERQKTLLKQVGSTYQNTADDDIKKKYNLNRYSYGLNSAGVYIYAHDTSKKIQEFLLMPKSRIKNEETEAPTTLLAGDVGMIRPVSDDRGFEVIGHQRYGRGSALRDGSLVLSETSDPNNTRANIGTQFALSGTLSDSLAAQSAGLTTIQTPYQNVADATARLTADDQETAAILDQGEPTYVPVEKTFVSTAPLGSPTQQGVPVSVEASQLSRALTLTEMSVRQSYLDQTNGTDPKIQCSCLTGRSDLAFIYAGYKIKTLKGSAPDESALPTGSSGEGATSTLSDADIATTARKQNYLDALGNGKPVAPNMMLDNPEGLTDLIEEYLYGLYDKIDVDHMEYEKTLRGEFLPQDPRTARDIRLGEGPTPEDTLEPPFGAANRAALGDPKALLTQASNALHDINGKVSKWKSFGDDIRAASLKTQYQGEISSLSKQVASLERDINRLTVSEDITGDAQKQIESIQKDIDSKQKQINDLSLKASQV